MLNTVPCVCRLPCKAFVMEQRCLCFDKEEAQWSERGVATARERERERESENQTTKDLLTSLNHQDLPLSIPTTSQLLLITNPTSSRHNKQHLAYRPQILGRVGSEIILSKTRVYVH